jgi:formimidoylglutamate deiminase
MFLHAAHALLDDGFHANVRISIANRDIVSVTPNSPAQPGDEILPGLLLPGTPNLHSHAFQRAFAGLTEFTGGGGDFWSWREAMYRTAACITPETCTAISAWVAKELLKGGYTTLAEFHYLHNRPDGARYAPVTTMARAVAEGAACAGIALTLLIGIYEAGGFDGAPLALGQKRFSNSAADALAMADNLSNDNDMIVGLALHSLRAVPPASLHRAAADFAGRGPIHIHVAEQRAEVQACIATLGAPPVAWLLDHAPVDAAWCLVHATHATDAEITAVARTGATIGLCPTTEANLGDGIFALPTLTDSCGLFGIGSDSNVTLDAFSELRLLEYSQRLHIEKRNVSVTGDGHTGRALYQSAATGGARACGRPAGHIAPGHRADLITIDATPETAHRPPDFWLDAAIFAAQRTPARHVMVGGTWQIRDFTHRNETAIDAAYHAALKSLAL